MAKYKLLAGKHVISFDPVVKAEPGDVVESDRDLVSLFGETKFELIPESVPESSEKVSDEPVAAVKKPVKKS